MIGQIRGNLIEKQPPHLMVEVQGIGYFLQAPLSTFFTLPELGAQVLLHTHMIVREDAQLLYGFATKAERGLFQAVIKVNGVGPKVALAILSGLSPLEFVEIIQSGEFQRLQKLPGIGAKTAQRILVEMKEVAKLNLVTQSAEGLNKVAATSDLASESTSEAIQALIALGYKQNEATKAVAKVKKTTTGCENIIKEALQGFAKV